MADDQWALDMIDVDKRYRGRGSSVTALDGLSLKIPAGTVFGLLGPNGAGKTSALEIAMGMRLADAGHVRTLGLDPVRDRHELTLRAAIQPQEVELFEFLTVRETLTTWASFYPSPLAVDDVLAELDMLDYRSRQVTKLSGGQRQRLNVALALIGDPRLLVLDEPSTGLDPVGRTRMWELLERTRDRGVSIILSTHLMEEAERVCDTVAIVDSGRCVVAGSPAGLVGDLGGERRVSFRFTGGAAGLDPLALAHVGRQMPGPGRDVVYLFTTDTDAALYALTRLDGAHDISVTTQRLADVYVHHTGKAWSEQATADLEGVLA